MKVAASKTGVALFVGGPERYQGVLGRHGKSYLTPAAHRTRAEFAPDGRA